MVSRRLGKRAPDEAHPVGYGKERFFWAFVAAMLIFRRGVVLDPPGVAVILSGEE